MTDGRMGAARSTCALALWCLLGLSACGVLPGGPAPSLPYHDVPRPRSVEPFPNWPVPPPTLERWMAKDIAEHSNERMVPRAVKGAGAGTTGAEEIRLFLPDEGVELKVKWKQAPARLDGPNNSPRRELGAYAVQKLFLDPEDWVVPASIFRCIPLDIVHAERPDLGSTIEGTTCLMGILSVWMRDVTVPDPLYDEARFLTDPQYAYFMSNLNLLTYLIGHKDGRGGNLLVASNPDRRQVFAVDNGVAFDIGYGGIWFNWFVPNWNRMRVPAVREDSIERLRRLERGDLDSLGVLATLSPDKTGTQLMPDGRTENLGPTRGARRRGYVVQLGLTTSEIDDVWERIQNLIRAVDEERIALF